MSEIVLDINLSIKFSDLEKLVHYLRYVLIIVLLWIYCLYITCVQYCLYISYEYNIIYISYECNIGCISYVFSNADITCECSNVYILYEYHLSRVCIKQCDWYHSYKTAPLTMNCWVLGNIVYSIIILLHLDVKFCTIYESC